MEISKTKRVVWDETGQDYAMFVKELGNLRTRVDGDWTREEAFDVHMEIGRVLYEYQLFKEALVSFKIACELQPVDVRPHFRAGNCLYALGKHSEAKGEFTLALEAAKNGSNQWDYLLPQIHVNLGIALEAEGEYKAAVKALEEDIFLKANYVDAHCDMASALHAIGDDEKAVQVFQQALDLKPSHVDVLYNMGGLYMEMGRYQRASEMYTRVLSVSPNHWRVQLNEAVALLGAGETKEAKRALKEALKITNWVELHDTVSHLKQL
ncbi:Tetratricopeptide repeat [Dillenia turbinata]|uniref:Tetratricopeptide repeat n=1 Tax=Dillenia turbinata TaxID=194707 RepID=A0AAN8VB26_9MAGN